MKISLYRFVILVPLFLFSSLQPVRADITLWEKTPEVPYQKVADIQVSVSGGFFHTAKASEIQQRLNQELLKTAKKYHADAMMDVKYFPEPEKSSYFRRHEYYAQATLIQYLKFPQPAAAQQQNAASANY